MDSGTIYADPPYPSATTTGYAVRDFDRDGLADVLMAQRGAVGISGYGDEWDVLGWRRVTGPALRRQINGGWGEARLEVLWLNGKAAGVVRVNNLASATEPSYAFRSGASCEGALGRVRARGGIGGCPVSGGRGWGWGLCCRPRGLAGAGKFYFPNVS